MRCIDSSTKILPSSKLTFFHFKAHISPIRKPVYKQIRIPRLHGDNCFRRYLLNLCCSGELKTLIVFCGCLTEISLRSAIGIFSSRAAYLRILFITERILLTVFGASPACPLFPFVKRKPLYAIISLLRIVCVAQLPNFGSK